MPTTIWILKSTGNSENISGLSVGLKSERKPPPNKHLDQSQVVIYLKPSLSNINQYVLPKPAPQTSNKANPRPPVSWCRKRHNNNNSLPSLSIHHRLGRRHSPTTRCLSRFPYHSHDVDQAQLGVDALPVRLLVQRPRTGADTGYQDDPERFSRAAGEGGIDSSSRSGYGY